MEITYHDLTDEQKADVHFCMASRYRAEGRFPPGMKLTDYRPNFTPAESNPVMCEMAECIRAEQKAIAELSEQAAKHDLVVRPRMDAGSAIGMALCASLIRRVLHSSARAVQCYTQACKKCWHMSASPRKR